MDATLQNLAWGQAQLFKALGLDNPAPASVTNILDLIEPGLEQWERYARLKATFPVLPVDMAGALAEHGGRIVDEVYTISQWNVPPISPMALQDYLKKQNATIGHKFFEGLVAKRRDSLYTFGRKPKQKVAEWIKHRFDQ